MKKKQKKFHKKGDIIRNRSGYHKCVCADKEIAIFAKSNGKGTRVKYTEMFAINPDYTYLGVIDGYKCAENSGGASYYLY